MLHECQTAEEVRRLAREQSAKRRAMYTPPRPIEPVKAEVVAPSVQAPPEPFIPPAPVIPGKQVTTIGGAPLPFEPPPPPRPTIRLIVSTVASHYGLTSDDLLSQRRTANIVLPRHIAMYLAKELTLRSLPYIGTRVGGKDHTTVLFGIRKIARLRQSDQALDAVLRELSELVTAAA